MTPEALEVSRAFHFAVALEAFVLAGLNVRAALVMRGATGQRARVVYRTARFMFVSYALLLLTVGAGAWAHRDLGFTWRLPAYIVVMLVSMWAVTLFSRVQRLNPHRG